MSFRVASYNIRNGRAFDWGNSWPLRRSATAATIEHVAADIVGLQEVYRFQYRWLHKRLVGFAGTWAGRNQDGRAGEGCPILVRSARATIAKVTVDGATLQVVNTHLDSRSVEHRRASVDQLVTWLDPALPRAVLGDFNVDPDDAVFTPLLEAGLSHALPPDAGGSDHRFTGATDGRRLDHILVSDDITVVHAEVARPQPGGRLGSDHWPVVADLRL